MHTDRSANLSVMCRRRCPVPARPRGLPWPSEREPVAVSIREAAELEGVTPDAIRARIARRTLRAFRLAGRLVIRVQDLGRYRKPGFS
jgi:hypothetical protein